MKPTVQVATQAETQENYYSDDDEEPSPKPEPPSTQPTQQQFNPWNTGPRSADDLLLFSQRINRRWFAKMTHFLI
jgi:hypothetical protein